MAEKRLYRSPDKKEGSYLIEIEGGWIEYDRATTDQELPLPYTQVACISEDQFWFAVQGRRIRYQPALKQALGSPGIPAMAA